GIHHTQINLRKLVSLCCREAIPLHGFLIILRHALSFLIGQTQTIQCRWVSLCRREAIPLYGFSIVLWHAFPSAYINPSFICAHSSSSVAARRYHFIAS